MSFQTITAAAREHPSRPAIVHDGNAISYAAFAGAIAATVSYLEKQGLPTHDTAAVIIYNLVDCWVTVLALQAIGLNTVCVRSMPVLDVLELGNVKHIVTTGPERLQHEFLSGAGTGSSVIAIPKPLYSSDESPRELAIGTSADVGGHILYTSGTTGSYKKLFFAGTLEQIRIAERTKYAESGLEPICYCADFGLWTAVGYKVPPTIWQEGGCVIFDQRADWHQHFLQTRMTKAYLIPELVIDLLNSLEEAPLSTPVADFTLRVTAGFISRHSAEKLLNRVTRNIVNSYGFTETNIGGLRSAVTDLNDLHWLSPNEFRSVEIVDDAGNVCPINVEGALRVRLTALDCSSYMDNEEATRNVFRGGYFYPGDMALRRADGRIRILGRSADVVNFRGQKYCVAPIEDKIQTVLGVNSACLFSGINNEGEEEVTIAIESDHWPEKSALDHLGHEFAEFDQVRFAIVYPFPRTQTGTRKIDRIALRKLVFTLDAPQ